MTRVPLVTRIAGAVLVALLFSAGLATLGASAASPEVVTGSSVTMTVEPLLGGSYRAGSWAPIRIRLENNGPPVDGEVRISGGGQESTFALAVQLASGARQEHVLHALVGPFGGRFNVALVSGASELAKVDLRVGTIEEGAPSVYVVAERPEALVGAIREAITSGGGREPSIASISADELPSRVQAWTSADVLVWQDVESGELDTQRLDALRAWLATGGHLVIFGGSTGIATLGGFPDEILPYRPERVSDVSLTDLQAMFGSVPADAAPVPAVVGAELRGTVLASSGDGVIAARTPYGQGSVALIGVDPAVPWLAAWDPAAGLWSRALPSTGPATDPVLAGSDDYLVFALGNLPSVQVPRFEHLALLVVGYVLAIGPLNYLVLRRRDRREWAWLTMPATMIVFALGAYGFGVSLRGASVIVNELAIVHGAAGTDRGVSEVHVGLYSPSRATFDVQVAGDALISIPMTSGWRGEADPQPLDVIQGDPSTLRDFGVGFGVQRSFRAESTVQTPRLDTNLTLTGDVAEGTVTNASDVQLAHVSVVYGNSFQVIGPMSPGETRPVQVVVDRSPTGMYLSEQMFPAADAGDPDAVRTIAARRAVMQQLAGASDGSLSRVFATGPVVLAWRTGGTLAIDVGTSARHVGETLFVLPARARAIGPTAFSRGLIRHTVLDADAVESFEEGGIFSMGRGTISAELAPLGFDGTFDVTGLSVRLGTTRGTPAAQADELEPLTAAEQPDSDTPLASNPRPDDGDPQAPRVQLFDRTAETWVEFPPLDLSRTYRIPNPERYVDSAGIFRVRFVVRDAGVYSEFTFEPLIEGTIR